MSAFSVLLRLFVLSLGLATTAVQAQEAPATPSPEEVLAQIQAQWASSRHADSTAPAFNRWNGDGSVPATCAGCHSTPGFLDFAGADGTAAGVVDGAHPTGSTVECAACHATDPAVFAKVVFPSGAEIEHGSGSGTCMTCHQGRASGATVDGAISGLSIGPDVVSPDLQFVNVHYAAAAAVMMGTDAKGGYEYEGRTYVGRFSHAPGADSCAACHDPHSTAVKVETCATCHGPAEPRAIRLAAPDYDGDGDRAEGVAAEIHDTHAALLAAIMDYAAKNGGPIGYAHAYPYFFADLNGNGEIDEDERTRDNAYRAFTPRLLRAVYNYQLVSVSPGSWIHNGRYAAQLLHDSLSDLAEGGAEVGALGERP